MADDGHRVYRQIEQAAGFYGPVTYAQLLTLFGDYGGYVVNADASDFIPVSAVNVFREKERILFAVGIIPPAADVTGRLLDRSASVLSLNGQEPTTTTESTETASTGPAPTPGNNVAQPPSGAGQHANTHKSVRQLLIEAFTEEMGRPPTEAELQYAHGVGWAETSYGRGWGSATANQAMVNSNNWGAVHCNKYSKGACIEFKDKHPDGTPYDQAFRAYPTPKDGAKDMIAKVFKNGGAGAGLTSGGSVFRASYNMRRNFYYGGFCPNATKEYGKQVARASFKDPDRDEGTKACAKEAATEHAKRLFQIMNDVALANGDSSVPALGTYEDADAWWRERQAQKNGGAVSGDSNAGAWVTDGSKNSQTSDKEQSKLGGTPLNSTKVGQALQAAQAAQILATQQALQRMASVPPLKLLVNPSKFSVKDDHIVQDGNWGRNGPIIEHWGDGQGKISASGKIAAFYAIDALNASGPGLTRHARNYSESWANFQSLYQIYRSNGRLLLPDPLNNNETQNISHVGSVYIYYDSVLYIGSFDTFNVTETDTSPFTVEYSFEFTIRCAFLLDRTDNAFTYGAPGLFPKATLPTSNPDPFSTPD
jgi:hypothetical protein